MHTLYGRYVSLYRDLGVCTQVVHVKNTLLIKEIVVAGSLCQYKKQ